MSDPIYVPLGDVATACGVSAYDLQRHYWPDDWGVPRDWRFVPQSSTVIVAERSLPALVAALNDAGLTEQAKKLDAWRAQIATQESHEEFTARHSATPREPDEPWWKKGQFQ